MVAAYLQDEIPNAIKPVIDRNAIRETEKVEHRTKACMLFQSKGKCPLNKVSLST